MISQMHQQIERGAREREPRTPELVVNVSSTPTADERALSPASAGSASGAKTPEINYEAENNISLHRGSLDHDHMPRLDAEALPPGPIADQSSSSSSSN